MVRLGLLPFVLAQLARSGHVPDMAISYRFKAEAIVTEPSTFTQDPNVEAAVAEGLGLATGVPEDYITATISETMGVQTLSTENVWELVLEKHLPSRGPVQVEYEINVPEDAELFQTVRPIDVSWALRTVAASTLQDRTMWAIHERAGQWTYIITFTQLLWVSAGSRLHAAFCTFVPAVLAFARTQTAL